MTLSDFIELSQAAAIIAGSIVAISGINAWKKQLIGRKRIELAEETLLAFHRAVASLERARHAGSNSNEGLTREKEDWEDESILKMRNVYFVPAERLNKDIDIFAELDALQFRCKIHFGDQVDSPFKSIKKIFFRIKTASTSLINITGESSFDSDVKFKDKMKKIIWDHSTENTQDEIAQEIQTELRAIEALLKPHLK